MKNIFKLVIALMGTSLVFAGCSNPAADMQENYDVIKKEYLDKGFVSTASIEDFEEVFEYTSASEYTMESTFDGETQKYICSEKNGNKLTVNGEEVETSMEDLEGVFGFGEGEEGIENEINVDPDELDENDVVTFTTEGEDIFTYMPADYMCEENFYLSDIEYMFEEIDGADYFEEDSKYEVEKDGDFFVIKDGKKELKIHKDGKELVYKGEYYTTTLKLK